MSEVMWENSMCNGALIAMRFRYLLDKRYSEMHFDVHSESGVVVRHSHIVSSAPLALTKFSKFHKHTESTRWLFNRMWCVIKPSQAQCDPSNTSWTHYFPLTCPLRAPMPLPKQRQHLGDVCASDWLGLPSSIVKTAGELMKVRKVVMVIRPDACIARDQHVPQGTLWCSGMDKVMERRDGLYPTMESVAVLDNEPKEKAFIPVHPLLHDWGVLVELPKPNSPFDVQLMLELAPWLLRECKKLAGLEPDFVPEVPMTAGVRQDGSVERWVVKPDVVNVLDVVSGLFSPTGRRRYTKRPAPLVGVEPNPGPGSCRRCAQCGLLAVFPTAVELCESCCLGMEQLGVEQHEEKEQQHVSESEDDIEPVSDGPVRTPPRRRTRRREPPPLEQPHRFKRQRVPFEPLPFRMVHSPSQPREPLTRSDSNNQQENDSPNMPLVGIEPNPGPGQFTTPPCMARDFSQSSSPVVHGWTYDDDLHQIYPPVDSDEDENDDRFVSPAPRPPAPAPVVDYTQIAKICTLYPSTDIVCWGCFWRWDTGTHDGVECTARANIHRVGKRVMEMARRKNTAALSLSP